MCARLNKSHFDNSVKSLSFLQYVRTRIILTNFQTLSLLKVAIEPTCY